MILLDYRDKRPIYEQIVEKLEKLIVSGGLSADEKMPSVRSLGMELSVNPNTIQRAYTQLEQEGYLYTVSGRGNFVAPESEWRDGIKTKVLGEWTEITKNAILSGLSADELHRKIDELYELSRKGEKPSGEEKR